MESNLVLTTAEMVFVGIVFAFGYVCGAITVYLLVTKIMRRRVPPPYSHEERIEKIKRTRPSLRNPMRTYDMRYDDFRTKRGLYEPVRPKGSTTRSKDDELEEL